MGGFIPEVETDWSQDLSGDNRSSNTDTSAVDLIAMVRHPERIANNCTRVGPIVEWVGEELAVHDMINSIVTAQNSDEIPNLFIDLEGSDGEGESIAPMQILICTINTVYLVDTLHLKIAAFDTPGGTGETLRSLLANAEFKKAFWDHWFPFAIHDVAMRGVDVIQVMALETGIGLKGGVVGFAHARKDLNICV
ncbi:hypothetical protein P152DRAFT_243023 [Eremomyces bilateralis CBS 781.70]|uniref:3'-5' exonuclease domain-containing protein n=1 Tax=Eremomyces bilateralis CBS 781.70 TaxID=1392243 RepID=A0A6G1GAK8_9PEZI|nr:uncharacterized protein P152DRAFT_243023 [Eremomyces bilateralis CBS 781.70]KAF1815042.1 hypothetical protein P152DRAFT_243023 [Eremomyces bilateralis CBS 781.70]